MSTSLPDSRGMMQAQVERFALADPGDVSGLSEAIDDGRVDPNTILAVIGKTHGNGLVNDYTRGYLTLALSTLIGECLDESAMQVRERIPFIFSGGVEGVLSPHYTVLCARRVPAAAAAPALALGIAFTPPLAPADVGREAQIAATAEAVRRAMQTACIEHAQDVHFVQVKGPAFDLRALAHPASVDEAPASDSPGKMMAFGRAASALGVARGLGEASDAASGASAVLREFGVFSSVASVSAGIEVRCNEVVVMGMSRHWTGPLRIDHETMRDAIDSPAVHRLACRLGFEGAPQLAGAETARLRAAFVKCEASRSGQIRGRRHTMLDDGDMDQQRHIRGAVGAIVAGVLGETALFVSGGAEHQGPDGGGLIALIAERSDG